MVEVIDRLDALAARQALSELDLATLESELCDMVETVLAEGVRCITASRDACDHG